MRPIPELGVIHKKIHHTHTSLKLSLAAYRTFLRARQVLEEKHETLLQCFYELEKAERLNHLDLPKGVR